MNALSTILNEVTAELTRAQTKFPETPLTTIALIEEVGELGQALLDKPYSEVRQEAVQVAVMALRVALEGDRSVDAFRNNKGLDKVGVM